MNTPSTTQAHGGSPADAPAFGRGLGTVMLDRRTKEWRRRCELIDMFTAAIGKGNVSAILAGQIETVAELTVAAELTRARFLGGDATADDVVRTSRAAGLAEKGLGIAPRTGRPQPQIPLRERLRGAA